MHPNFGLRVWDHQIEKPHHLLLYSECQNKQIIWVKSTINNKISSNMRTFNLLRVTIHFVGVGNHFMHSITRNLSKNFSWEPHERNNISMRKNNRRDCGLENPIHTEIKRFRFAKLAEHTLSGTSNVQTKKSSPNDFRVILESRYNVTDHRD